MNHSDRSAILQESLTSNPGIGPHKISASVLADMIVEYATHYPGTHKEAYEKLLNAITDILDTKRLEQSKKGKDH